MRTLILSASAIAYTALSVPALAADTSDLQGVRGFGGLGFGFGPTLHAYEVNGDLEGPDTYGGSLFALQAGAFLNRLELMLEWAPGTFTPMSNDDPPHIDAGESFYSVVGSVGYYIPVTDIVYFPMRAGAGVGSSRNDFVARIDLLNVAVKLDRFVLSTSFPSIRYMSDFDRYHRFTGVFSLNATCLFP